MKNKNLLIIGAIALMCILALALILLAVFFLPSAMNKGGTNQPTVDSPSNVVKSYFSELMLESPDYRRAYNLVSEDAKKVVDYNTWLYIHGTNRQGYSIQGITFEFTGIDKEQIAGDRANVTFTIKHGLGANAKYAETDRINKTHTIELVREPGGWKITKNYDLSFLLDGGSFFASYNIKIAKTTTTTTLTRKTTSSTISRKIIGKNISVILLYDKRCATCNITNMVSQLNDVFPEIEYTELDYGTIEGSKLYDESNLTYLPAVLFTEDVKNFEGYESVKQYLNSAGSYLSLKIGSSFDPKAENCGNGIDDNGDGMIDCADSLCAATLECSKNEKPVVELFIMSHCPYGTQVEKGILPVARLLGNSMDFSVKYCDYAMHGEKELKEQMLQYCVQRDYKDKYLDYLECFLAEGNTDECITKTGLDRTNLNSCINETDKKYEVTRGFKDKSTWQNGYFPQFKVYKDLNVKYKIQGSPTIVLNGVIVDQPKFRDPQSLLDLICKSYTSKPPACSQKLSTEVYSAGFGFNKVSGGDSTSAVSG
ncbi:MAG: hypothetical protein NTZ34_04870 [Chloroflexi bacterium]|nr:hypothetical protein [Chloroflexota bacterium]